LNSQVQEQGQQVVKTIAEYSAAGLELLGICIMLVLVAYATVRALMLLASRHHTDEVFHAYRHQLVKAILLGLELLVAADIIHTVAIELTFKSVGVLAAVVLIRTFLSFTLEVEMNGRWPWQESTPEKGNDQR